VLYNLNEIMFLPRADNFLFWFEVHYGYSKTLMDSLAAVYACIVPNRF